MRWAAIVVFGAMVAGASLARPVDSSSGAIKPEDLTRTLDALRDSVDDPESLQVRRLRYANQGLTVCGQYNARTERGGYHPFRDFMATGKTAFAEPNASDAVQRAAKKMIADTCGK